MYCDDIQDMRLSITLQSLIGLFIEQLNQPTHLESETIKNQLRQWIDSQALFIKALFKDLR
ncbi:hypothetical protein [Cellulosilyticum ruminicola]|uniref:hypothetical protein n=1 Tax=Cellulosilyticum ruminicola TaxID=425254 RepID=UPI0006D1DDB1|nr:hypothetical protein [Cellulosilyticum ruminicola]